MSDIEQKIQTHASEAQLAARATLRQLFENNPLRRNSY